MVDTSTYRNFWSGSNQQRLMCSNGTHSQRDLRNFCVAGWVQVCITDHTSKGHLGHVPYRLCRRIGHAIYRAFLSSLTSCVEFVERLKLRQPNELLHYGLTKCLFTFALKILCLYIIRRQQQPKPQFIKYNQFERRSLMHAELLDARVRCMFWFAIITEVQCIQENTVCSQSVSCGANFVSAGLVCDQIKQPKDVRLHANQSPDHLGLFDVLETGGMFRNTIQMECLFDRNRTLP
ncbi:Hypothetical_protein [Hexamita inflata]|uniref:Hypothetical_protein n=1 Tax=Hexamita inflata TaxID=28002 RepID=A0AA86QXW8_9EUKA|nr:Hypothetical protein HINF_LOCUS49448 [Hexamita inflata]